MEYKVCKPHKIMKEHDSIPITNEEGKLNINHTRLSYDTFFTSKRLVQLRANLLKVGKGVFLSLGKRKKRLRSIQLLRVPHSQRWSS